MPLSIKTPTTTKEVPVPQQPKTPPHQPSSSAQAAPKAASVTQKPTPPPTKKAASDPKQSPTPFRSIKTAQEKNRLKQFLGQYRENEQAWAYTETALTIFLVAVFIFFAIRPAIITVTGLLSEIRAKEALVLKIRTKINSVVQAQDTYAQVQSRHEVLDSFLPDTPRYTHTAAQVQGTSQDTNSNVSQISFTIPNEKEESRRKKTQNTTQSKVVPVIFSTNTTTSYQNLLNFLRSITQNRRLITPEEFTLSQPKEGLKNETLGKDEILINLRGSSYYWNE